MKLVEFPQLSLPPPKSAFIPAPISPSRRRSYPLKKPSLYSSSYSRQMAAPSSSPAAIRLQPIEATPESFREFGQVIEASPDGDEFGPLDAHLDLSRGIPRFYIMHLEDRPLRFSTITHHASVTQCLGSIGGHVWYLGVARPSLVNPGENEAEDAVKSQCGHSYIPPAVDSVRVFKVSGPKFLKLDRGTWHAGPLLLEKTMDFYNLELGNTNVESAGLFLGTFLGTTMRIPCEVLKQRLQAGQFNHVGEALVGTWQQDGLGAFFRGTGMTLCRELPFYVAGAGLYAESKKAVQKLLGRELEPWETVVVGAVSGGLTAVMTTPFDVIKTRMMTALQGEPTTMSVVALSILRHEGPLGLFRGAVPRFFWVAPLGAINFAGYELMRKAMG